VPGAVAAWVSLSERFGKLPFADLLEPAIEVAERGYLVPVVVAEKWMLAAVSWWLGWLTYCSPWRGKLKKYCLQVCAHSASLLPLLNYFVFYLNIWWAMLSFR
jgi:hypothetical protein